MKIDLTEFSKRMMKQYEENDKLRKAAAEKYAPLTFTLDPWAREKLHEWCCKHECSIGYAGAIGGKLTYSFTPNSLGMVTKVTCACGDEVDVTDYDEW